MLNRQSQNPEVIVDLNQLPNYINVPEKPADAEINQSASEYFRSGRLSVLCGAFGSFIGISLLLLGFEGGTLETGQIIVDSTTVAIASHSFLRARRSFAKATQLERAAPTFVEINPDQILENMPSVPPFMQNAENTWNPQNMPPTDEKA